MDKEGLNRIKNFETSELRKIDPKVYFRLVTFFSDLKQEDFPEVVLITSNRNSKLSVMVDVYKKLVKKGDKNKQAGRRLREAEKIVNAISAALEGQHHLHARIIEQKKEESKKKQPPLPTMSESIATQEFPKVTDKNARSLLEEARELEKKARELEQRAQEEMEKYRSTKSYGHYSISNSLTEQAFNSYVDAASHMEAAAKILEGKENENHGIDAKPIYKKALGLYVKEGPLNIVGSNEFFLSIAECALKADDTHTAMECFGELSSRYHRRGDLAKCEEYALTAIRCVEKDLSRKGAEALHDLAFRIHDIIENANFPKERLEKIVREFTEMYVSICVKQFDIEVNSKRPLIYSPLIELIHKAKFYYYSDTKHVYLDLTEKIKDYICFCAYMATQGFASEWKEGRFDDDRARRATIVAEYLREYGEFLGAPNKQIIDACYLGSVLSFFWSNQIDSLRMLDEVARAKYLSLDPEMPIGKKMGEVYEAVSRIKYTVEPLTTTQEYPLHKLKLTRLAEVSLMAAMNLKLQILEDAGIKADSSLLDEFQEKLTKIGDRPEERARLYEAFDERLTKAVNAWFLAKCKGILSQLEDGPITTIREETNLHPSEKKAVPIEIADYKDLNYTDGMLFSISYQKRAAAKFDENGTIYIGDHSIGSKRNELIAILFHERIHAEAQMHGNGEFKLGDAQPRYIKWLNEGMVEFVTRRYLNQPFNQVIYDSETEVIKRLSAVLDNDAMITRACLTGSLDEIAERLRLAKGKNVIAELMAKKNGIDALAYLDQIGVKG